MRWITTGELMEMFDLTIAELNELGRESSKQGIKFYEYWGEEITHAIWEQPHPDITFPDCKLKVSEIRDLITKLRPDLTEYIKKKNPKAACFLSEQNNIEPGQKSQMVDSKPLSFPVPDGTPWNQVRFKIVNENYVEVSLPGKRQNFETETLGFSEKESLWALFKLFAQENGNLKPSNSIKPIKANVSNLRKHLQRLFPSIQGKPIKDYSKTDGYVCNFMISAREI